MKSLACSAIRHCMHRTQQLQSGLKAVSIHAHVSLENNCAQGAMLTNHVSRYMI